MKVLRISIWSPDLTPMTVVVPEDSLRGDNVSVDDFIEQMHDGPPGTFFTHEFAEVESADLQVQTFEAIRVFQDHEADERNMALMYYWTANQLRRVTPGGVAAQTIPSPLSVEQLKYVLSHLVKHPYYRNQRLIAISQDKRVVEAQYDRIQEML